MKSRLHLIVVLLFIVVAGVIFISFKNTSKDTDVIKIEENISKKLSSVTTSSITASNEVIKPKKEIFVHVCGEVKKEGVYTIKPDGRVVDAIKAAGGFTKSAARYGINQAELLKDGMQVYIPSKKEIKNKPVTPVTNSPVLGNSESLVNINSATKEELMTLKGVGESRATLIIEYREKSGGFNDIKDIMKIKGIKQKFFDKIKDKICI